ADRTKSNGSIAADVPSRKAERLRILRGRNVGCIERRNQIRQRDDVALLKRCTDSTITEVDLKQFLRTLLNEVRLSGRGHADDAVIECERCDVGRTRR